MDKLLIKGRYSTYTNSRGEENIPIERKKDIREDASWCVKNDTIERCLSDEQAADIRYEHEKIKGVSITDNDIIRKQIGEPTHPITKALLEAQYQYQVDTEIRKTHGKKGWLERIFAPEAIFYAPYQSPIQVRRKPLQDMKNDDELLGIMFNWFKIVGSAPFNLFGPDYSKTLEEHFKGRSGMTLEHTLKEWPDRSGSNLNKLINSLEGYIMQSYQNNMTQDISNVIKENWINFSNTWKLSYRAAFGGIQEVELKGYLVNVKKKEKGDQFDKFDKIQHDPTVLEVKLDFIIKDWFGVDEEDVYKNEKSAQIGRDALAAFWILQHQRGYQPFINLIKYTEIKDYIFQK